MKQEPKGPAPVGVVYNTSMARADAALALAALYVSASRRDARVDGICVTGSGFDAAVFCDIVARVYTGQTRPSSNSVLPIGFADGASAAPAMVERAVKRRRDDGQPQYSRSVQSVADTGLPEALLRNAVTLSVETVVLLSAPATSLARSLALAGTAALYRQRVRRVVIVEAGDADGGRSGLNALISALPAPPIVCGREVGAALTVPRARLTAALSWNKANPVADALATEDGDVRLHDLAALHYALHPDSGFFTADQGRLALTHSKISECVDELVALATSQPAVPPSRGG